MSWARPRRVFGSVCTGNMVPVRNQMEPTAQTNADPTANIVVSEVDTSPAQTITATLTLNNTAAGVLTTSGTATYTPGTGVWTITGTVAEVNTALAAVSFTPASLSFS